MSMLHVESRFAGDICGCPDPIDPLEFYASGIDSSDYVARVAPLIRRFVPEVGDLIDVGAGGGQLGASLLDVGAQWLAIEPGAVMQTRLRAMPQAPDVIPSSWDDPAIVLTPASTVLAANMPAPLTAPAAFLKRCRSWARKNIVWVVPAQNGPRGLCLAGCLPKEWHGEDETPGVDLVLAGIGADQPDLMDATDWTFSLVTSDLARLASYLADRLNWPEADPRRPALFTHLADQAEPTSEGLRLSVHRRSAILVWKCNDQIRVS